MDEHYRSSDTSRAVYQLFGYIVVILGIAFGVSAVLLVRWII
jgi:hypothetical protein